MNIISSCSTIILTISIANLEAWPTLKLDIFHYTYNMTDPRYIQFNITKIQLRDNIDLYASTSIHLESNGKQYATEFVNKTISVCRLIHDRRYEPFLRTLHSMLKEFSPEFINKCPIKKKLYYIRLVNFQTDKIPPVWPEKAVRVFAKYFSKEKNVFRQLFSFTLYAKVIKTNK